MDDRRFDEVSKYLSTGVSRKGVLRLLGGLGAAGVAATSALQPTDAKKKRGKGKGKGKGKKGNSGRAKGTVTCIEYGQPCENNPNDCCGKDANGVVCQKPQGGDQGAKTCNCPGLNDGGGKPNFETDPNNCGRCGNVCKAGDTCVAGKCEPPVPVGCNGDDKCGSGEVCCDNICVVGDCCSTKDCKGEGETCEEHVCTPKVGCETNTDCGDGKVCCGEICVVGDCCSSNDCPKDETCVEHICTPTVGCQKDEDCAKGQICCNEICVAGDCCDDKDCDKNETCTNHTCTPGCTPKTCAADYAGQCGTFPQGCGLPELSCTCDVDETCNDQGVCVVIPGCVPISQAVACAGLQCGPASNGCGVDYECGTGCAPKKKKGQRPIKQTCVSGVCLASKKKRCIGKGLAGQPCSGKCKCKNGRKCNNGRCCEGTGDGSVHCNSNSECCPGLMCAYRRPGQHRVCMPRNAKGIFIESTEATATPGLAVGALLTGLVARLGTKLTGNGESASVAMDEVQIHALSPRD